MKFNIRSIALLCLLGVSACAGSSAQNETSSANVVVVSTAQNSEQQPANPIIKDGFAGSDNKNTNNRAALDKEPRTIRDFFMILPEKYFTLESCDYAKDKDCQQAKLNYLKSFSEIEDIANGYLKGSCDGAQACLEMAIFKRPDNKYIVGLGVSHEMMDMYYFLDYENGKWTDVSAKIVPQFSKKNMYELPRKGTTVKVFAKKIIEKGDDYEVSEKGEKLYDLEWSNGKFSIKR
jgi:hypothetical protein